MRFPEQVSAGSALHQLVQRAAHEQGIVGALIEGTEVAAHRCGTDDETPLVKVRIPSTGLYVLYMQVEGEWVQ